MSIKDSSTVSMQVVYGDSAVTFNGVSTFTLQLPASGFTTGRDELALKSMTTYYSWPNISAALGNNAFSYTFSGTSYPVVLPTGIFQFSDFIAYLQQVMFANGHYLLDNTGTPVYFISLVLNTPLYCLSLTCTPVPTSLPSGWSNPNAIALSGHCPQLVIPSTAITSLTGFAAGSYPATSTQTTVFQLNSGIPQISQVTSLGLTCTMVQNSTYSLRSNLLASIIMPAGTLGGSLVTFAPYQLDFIPATSQYQFQTISVSLVDQLGRPVTILDPTGFSAIINIRRRV